jgi:hypothetical protein
MDMFTSSNCPNCGGPVTPTSNIILCEYCGSKILYNGSIFEIVEKPELQTLLCPTCNKDDKVYKLYDLYCNYQAKFKDIIHLMKPPQEITGREAFNSSSYADKSFIRKKAPVRAWVVLIIGVVWLLVDIAFRAFAAASLSNNPTTFGGVPVSSALWQPFNVIQGWLCPGIFLLWAVVEFIAVGMNNSTRANQYRAANMQEQNKLKNATKQMSIFKARYRVWANLFYCDRDQSIFLKSGDQDTLENIQHFISSEAAKS